MWFMEVLYSFIYLYTLVLTLALTWINNLVNMNTISKR